MIGLGSVDPAVKVVAETVPGEMVVAVIALVVIVPELVIVVEVMVEVTTESVTKGAAAHAGKGTNKINSRKNNLRVILKSSILL